MNLLIAAVALWLLAMCRRRGAWPVFRYWALITTCAVIGMAFGGWL